MIARRRTGRFAGVLVGAGVLATGGIALAIAGAGAASSGDAHPTARLAAVVTQPSSDGIAKTGSRLVGRGAMAPITQVIGAPAQRATRAFWTPARMKSATATGNWSGVGASGVGASRVDASEVSGGGTAGVGGGTRSAAGTSFGAETKSGAAAFGAQATAPKGIPTATKFSGVLTIGALFYTTGGKAHFCTASTVDSSSRDLILTAGHCVYWSGYVRNVEYVPDYDSGQQPLGAWPVQRIMIAAGWKKNHNANLDFAFVQVAPPSGTDEQLQTITGGLKLGINHGYDHDIEVVGYNDSYSEPVKCATKSKEFRTDQMEFLCHDYYDGTSGGPWITGWDATTGTGTVFGNIGGYEQGGDYEWLSYSPYYNSAISDLFHNAQVIAS